MVNNKPTILFDHRDRSRWINSVQPLLRTKCSFKETSLPLGDIEWPGSHNKTHLMEMKIASDMSVSLANERLQDEVARLVEWQDEEPELRQAHLMMVGYIVPDVNGYIAYSDNSLGTPDFTAMRLPGTGQSYIPPVLKAGSRRYSHYKAYLTSVKTMGILVHEGVDPASFGTTFVTLYNWTTKQAHSMPRRRKVSLVRPQLTALMALIPALNLPTAQRVLREFGTITNVLTAHPENLSEVSGVGPRVIQQLTAAAEKDFTDAKF